MALVLPCHKAIPMKKKKTFGLVKPTYRDYIAAADIISQHSAERLVDSVVCFASAVLICGVSFSRCGPIFGCGAYIISAISVFLFTAGPVYNISRDTSSHGHTGLPHATFELFHSITSVLPAALESDAWVRLSSAARSLKGPLTHGRTATWRVRARVCVKCRSEPCCAAVASCLLWARLSRPHRLSLNFTSASICVFVSAILSAPFTPPPRPAPITFVVRGACFSKTEGRCMGRGPVLAQTKSTSCDDLSKTPRTQQHQRWSLAWLHADHFLE